MGVSLEQVYAELRRNREEINLIKSSAKLPIQFLLNGGDTENLIISAYNTSKSITEKIAFPTYNFGSYIQRSELNIVDGVAGLDENTLIYSHLIPQLPISKVTNLQTDLDARLGINATAQDSLNLGGQLPAYYATASSVYNQTQINDAIVTAKNEVLALVLDNPDATTNSITEVLALMSSEDATLTTSIAEKVSYTTAQSLTTAQKTIAQTNIGLENAVLTNQANVFGNFIQTFGGNVNLNGQVLAFNQGSTNYQIYTVGANIYMRDNTNGTDLMRWESAKVRSYVAMQLDSTLDVISTSNLNGNVNIGGQTGTRPLNVYRSTDGSIATFLSYTDGANFQGLYVDVSQATNDVTFNSSGTSSGGYDFQTGSVSRFTISSAGTAIFTGTTQVDKLYIKNSTTGIDSDGNNLYLKSAGNTYLNSNNSAFISPSGAGAFVDNLSVTGASPHIQIKTTASTTSASGAIDFMSSEGTRRWQLGVGQTIGSGFEINEGSANRFYMAPGGNFDFKLGTMLIGNVTTFGTGANGGTINWDATDFHIRSKAGKGLFFNSTGEDSTFGGDVTISNGFPRFNLYSTDGGEDDWSIVNKNGTFGIYNNTDAVYRYEISAGGNHDLKEGTVTIGDTLFIPNRISHIGDSDTYFGFSNNNNFELVVGGNQNISSNINAVFLKYAGISKITTTSSGVDITGDLGVTGTGAFGNIVGVDSATGVETQINLNQNAVVRWRILNKATTGIFALNDGSGDLLTLTKSTGNLGVAGNSAFNGDVTIGSTTTDKLLTIKRAQTGNFMEFTRGSSLVASFYASSGGLGINSIAGGITIFNSISADVDFQVNYDFGSAFNINGATAKAVFANSVTASDFIGNWNGKTLTQFNAKYDSSNFGKTQIDTLGLNYNSLVNKPSLNFDNYQYFNLKTNSVQRKQIGSLDQIDIMQGAGISIAYSSNGGVNISNSITNNNQLTNGAGYLTAHQSLASYATQSWVGSQGFITDADGGDADTVDGIHFWKGTQTEYDALSSVQKNDASYTHLIFAA